LAPDELTVEAGLRVLDTPVERVLGDDPETDLPVIARSGRFGPYVSLGRPPEQTKLSLEMSRLMALPLRRTEMKVALSYLRLAAGSVDEPVARRVINTPRRGVGKGALERVDALAEREGIGFLEALGRADEAGVTGRPLAGIGSFLELRGALVARDGDGPASVLQTALDDSGYLDELRASGDEDSDRVQNLEDLVSAVAGFDDVVGLLEQIDEMTSVEDRP
jgi:DNA helicase-2/ATP-dependent DNA helicase PcrA